MILKMIKRNLKLYFRDKTAVFSSLMGVIIIIGLYLLFLGNFLSNGLQEIIPNKTRFIIDAWVMAGVISIASITTSMGAFGIMIQDKTKKIIYDFKVAPITRFGLVISYVISALIISFIMSIITLAFSEIYFLVNDGQIIGIVYMLKSLIWILFSVIVSSTLVFMLTSFVESNTGFSTISSMIGSLIGFVTGIFIPIGNLPSSVQTVIKIFPLTHAATLMRQSLISGVTDLSNIPQEFKSFMGVNLEVNGNILTSTQHIIYMLISSVIFLMIAVWIVSKKRKSI